MNSVDEAYLGYKGRVAGILKNMGLDVGDRIKIVRGDRVFEGVLMPREKLYGSRPIVVIKLDNGYNVGVRIDETTRIELVEKKKQRVYTKPKIVQRSDLPHVAFLSTGGTIVSKVDYETGAVKPALSVEELLEWVPEIGETAYIDAKIILNVFSEDLTPSHWALIAEKVYEEFKKGKAGVVIAHGTDTMGYTAAALAFAIRRKPGPIVFVGAQRSSDRPSTDSAFNLKSAFLVAAQADIAESVVVMHGETGDTYALVHRGVKVRKMHTSRRDAFQSINDLPIARVFPDEKKIEIIGKVLHRRNKDGEPVLRNKFDDKVALIKFYPGMHPDIFEHLIDDDYHGIVVEGTGLGHIANRLIPVLEKARKEGIPVVITSQCLFGRIDLYVYSTGRRLIEAGVIPGSDMLPETAYVKLSWILGSHTTDLDKVRELMLKNFEGEINPRLTVNLYPRWII